ncbi:MAG: hypothetical protein ABI232_13530 [Jatrophihabitantaceae bacterium]
MGWLPRRKKGPDGTLREADSADVTHLTEFVKTRSGVEAYLEPQTAVTASTVVLVAGTGEWTRRRVDGPDAAAKFARKHAIPLYESTIIGYPQRMRDWTAKRKAEGQTGVPRAGDPPA